MTFIRKLGAPAIALAFGVGTILSAAPALASKDRVEHQDRGDRGDRGQVKGQDRVNHDKGEKNDKNGGDKNGGEKDGGDQNDH